MIGALDLGGTHVSAARVDSASAAVDAASRRRVPLPADGDRSALLERIIGAAEAITDARIRAWGIAVPGPFDYAHGVSQLRHKLEALYGVDLRGELAAAVGADRDRIVFLNDADAFLLGEWWAGAARGSERALGVTLGSGLGSAFLADGRIVHMGRDVPPRGELHVIPFRGGPVENRISARGLLTRYGDDAVLDGAQVADRARSGDVRASSAFMELGSELAEFLAPWLAGFDATCLVVGGSIARAWDLIEPSLRSGLAAVGTLERVTVAARIDDAPLLGAARHAESRGAA